MSDESTKIARRAFLQIVGAAGAVAGCSPVSTAKKLVPYLDPPVDQVPGVPVFYRSVCRECSAACGVTARTREGRVVKLEGNPDDPVSGGALCARGQASVQALYSPARLKGPMKRTAAGALEPISWDDALALVATALGASHAKNGSRGVRLLTRPEPGATGAIQKELLGAIGADASQRVVFDPLDPIALRDATAALFGTRELPRFDLGAARTVVSFGADFLETWVSPVELTRAFASGRGRPAPSRTRLVWVGPRLSATAASADEWLSVRPGTEAIVALGLVRWLADPANGVASLPPDASRVRALVDAFTVAAVESRSGLATGALARLGGELATRRPSAILPGAASTAGDARALAIAALLANHLLGNAGATLRFDGEIADPPSPSDALSSLVADATRGIVDVLFLHHADPAGTIPGAAAALGAVPFVVSFSDRLDETTRLAHLVLPDAHPLEAWEDLPTRAGRLVIGQPAMTPLADTRAAAQTLLDLAGKLAFAAGPITATDAGDYVRARVDAAAGGGEGSRTAIQRGGIFGAASAASSTPVVAAPKLDGLAPFELSAPPSDGLSLVVFPTVLRGDGRSDATWLKEVGDPTSTVAWTAWVEVSPATASRLALANGRNVALQTSAGRTELPVYVYPGLRDDVVAVPLGGGEAVRLLPARAAAPAVTLTRLGRAMLPQIEGMPEPHAGALLAQARSEEKGAPLPRIAKLPMYEPPPSRKRRWAMTIDLDKCVGCAACTVACYAENNLPVLGPERIDEGRSMAWLKVDRFFGDGAQPSVEFVPMLCQHCDNAPCEVVCPVDATYHTGEGLNAQVYNRCVGTRYCANNCPYKVRVFNWQDPAFASPLEMQLNPDVNVRSKGVMEKCSFCIQRIRFAENAARDEGREVRDGDVVPACAQTCPAKAIVFGDELDPASAVAASRKDPRGFRALEELNTRPAITYLARGGDEEKTR